MYIIANIIVRYNLLECYFFVVLDEAPPKHIPNTWLKLYNQ